MAQIDQAHHDDDHGEEEVMTLLPTASEERCNEKRGFEKVWLLIIQESRLSRRRFNIWVVLTAALLVLVTACRKAEQLPPISTDPTDVGSFSIASESEDFETSSPSPAKSKVVPMTNVTASTAAPSTAPSSHTFVPSTVPSSEVAINATTDDVEDPLYQIHLPFGDNQTQYRRVCAWVHSSLLCLTVQYPDKSPVQDPDLNYAHPVDERFLNYSKQANFIDEETYLWECQNNNDARASSFDEKVRACLNAHMEKQQQQREKSNSTGDGSPAAVLGVWTKGLNMESMEFYGTQVSPRKQGARVDEYFRDHIIWGFGDSTGKEMIQCIKDLFDTCGVITLKPVGAECKAHNYSAGDGRDRELRNRYKPRGIPDSAKYFIGSHRWEPIDLRDDQVGEHRLPDLTLPELLASPDFARPSSSPPRKLTILALHPIAHTQSEKTILYNQSQIERLQKGYVNALMQVQSEQGKQKLLEAGYDLQHLIAFDGRPQFFPTASGAYSPCVSNTDEKTFLSGESQNCPGHLPEYGSRCRGPLLPTSPMKSVNSISRKAYEIEGLDIRYYGRTWEFANLFWYQTANWSRKGLDCTHAIMESGLIPMQTGLACVYKYFLMAMIDDHFDTNDAANGK